MTLALRPELDRAEALAREVGQLAERYCARGLTSIEHKTGADDPVTEADRAASALLVRELGAAFPADGLLSEEETDGAARLAQRRVWLIDPIDGTRDYAAGSPEYCVSIGLAVDGEPVLGVIYAPATDELFSGAVGLGLQKNAQAIVSPSPVSPSPMPPYRVGTSDTETRLELQQLPLPGMVPSGSTALKLARAAAGELDATFTIAPRAEWDIAAGHALLRAAGGDLVQRDGGAVRYNQPYPYLLQGLAAGRPPALAWLRGELARLEVPTTALALQADAHGQRRHERRLENGRALAWLVTGEAGEVLQTGGDALQLSRLTRDVRRAGLLPAS